MKSIPALYRDELAEMAGSEYLEAVLRSIAQACGLSLAEQARLISARQCLSCGAYQNINGDLPCNH